MADYIHGQLSWYALKDELPFQDDTSELTELCRKDFEFRKKFERDVEGRYEVFRQSLIIVGSPESGTVRKPNQDAIIFEPLKDQNHMQILHAMRNKAAIGIKKKERLKKIINYMICEQDQKMAIRETQRDLRLSHRYLAGLSNFECGGTEINDLMMDVGHAITEKIQYTPAPLVYEYENGSEESSDDK